MFACGVQSVNDAVAETQKRIAALREGGTAQEGSSSQVRSSAGSKCCTLHAQSHIRGCHRPSSAHCLHATTSHDVAEWVNFIFGIRYRRASHRCSQRGPRGPRSCQKCGWTPPSPRSLGACRCPSLHRRWHRQRLPPPASLQRSPAQAWSCLEATSCLRTLRLHHVPSQAGPSQACSCLCCYRCCPGQLQGI